MKENNSFRHSCRLALVVMMAEPLGKKWPILIETWPKNRLVGMGPGKGLREAQNFRHPLKLKMRENIRKMGGNRRKSNKIEKIAINKRK